MWFFQQSFDCFQIEGGRQTVRSYEIATIDYQAFLTDVRFDLLKVQRAAETLGNDAAVEASVRFAKRNSR